jgi:hypothetical protein
MIKVFRNEGKFVYENLLYEPVDNGVEILAKWGCSSKAISEKEFAIFGGIYDNENDFKMVGTGVYRVEIKETSKYKAFTIHALPKVSRTNATVACLKPKINYIVRPCKDSNE